MRSYLLPVLFIGLLSTAHAILPSCTVSSTADTGASGTLRYCLTSPTSGLVITISARGTITLASALPAISTNLTINGPGANQLTISGNNAYQVFIINSGTVGISGLTIANGLAPSNGYGGGISNGGTLTVTNCAFSANVTNNGSNNVPSGGAIYTTGTLNVSGSTFVNNSATSGSGGAIYINSGTTTVYNSTFVSNSADSGGGAFYSNGNLTLTNSTLSANSGTDDGAIFSGDGSETLNNNIFAGNDVLNLGFTINASNNVFYHSLCHYCTTNSNEKTTNPLLLQLGNYGGTTETMALAPGSAAICNGSASLASSASVTADQRGFALDPTCASGLVDAGAVQTNQYVVNSLADSSDGSNNCNPSGSGTTCSLRDATFLAAENFTNYGYGGDITFLSSLTSVNTQGTINLSSVATPAGTGSTLTIGGVTNILGPGANQLTISSDYDTDLGTVLAVNSGAQVLLYGLTIAQAYTNGNAGGINNQSTLTVMDSAIFDNMALGNGGGIYSDGTLTLIDSTVSSNTAAFANGGGGGGGIYSTGTLTLTESTVAGNFTGFLSTTGGGGIYNDGGSATLTASTVSGNSADGSCITIPLEPPYCIGGSGGGILNSGTLTLTNSIAAGNSAQSTANSGDCVGAGCPSNGSSNLIGGVPNLAPLGSYGGTTLTMIPLPGSPAICDGLAANIPSGFTTDQRGFPNTNTTYTSGTCVDAGAVQTNYQSLQFSKSTYNGYISQAISPAPIVSVTENGQNIGAVPISLNDASLTVSGLGPVVTIAGTGATFSSVEDSVGEDTSLVASLQLTPEAISPAFTLTASAALDVSSIIPAALTTPTPGTTLTGTSVTFAWSPGNTATHFELWLGTINGSSNLYNSGSVTVTTETVSNLPSNGQPVYARLYYYIYGSWQYASYTYTAYGAPTPATLITPTPGSTFTATSIAFTWAPGNVAKNFELWIGTTAGSTNIYDSGSVTVTTETVSNLPGNGQPVYARLYSYINGAWQYTSYTYTASGSPTPAALTTPAPSSKLTGTSIAFSWSPGNVAKNFELWVGTTAGSTNIYNSGSVTATTETVNGLPSNGQPVYVRLYSYIDGAWQYTSYTYTATGSPTLASLTTPAPSSTLTSTSVAFSWNPGNVAKNFELWLGTTNGASNLYNSGSVTATTETVNGLPSNSEKIYARLYSYIDGAWQYTSYTYTAY
jgi:predicted outer membrane repeat protein